MIENRKEEHINIAENMNVTSEHNFWEDIRLIHKAMPEVDYDAINTKINFLGTDFDLPFLISSMTGGTEKARKINANLAKAAEEFNIGIGVGSMRAAIENKNIADTFSVINNYKIPAKFANIGAPQLIRQDKPPISDKDIEYIFNLIEAKYLIVHFNFLQEMVQPEGDKNAKGVKTRLKELAKSYPVIAKETGSGFSREDALELKDAGVKAIDVGGLGGTSFAAIEYYRAEKIQNKEKMHTGQTFWNWGIPSPASIKYCSVGIPVIGSGGIRNGQDIVKSMVIGADMGAMARNFLKDADTSYDQLTLHIKNIIKDIKISMFLTGSKDIKELKTRKYIIFDPLYSWLNQGD
jgi:isopentenyl-diphosphate delta-isomerase